MDLSQFSGVTPALRRDGWSAELKLRFLDHLAAKGTVRGACASAGMSPEAAYRLRRRDALFARGWAAALGLARENAADVLACRALDGIEEEVWFRGELVGTRRRHDSRLLLAHLARLDRLVEQHPGGADGARFDELLALIAGEEVPDEIAGEEDALPPERETFAEAAAVLAEAAYREACLPGCGPDSAADDQEPDEEAGAEDELLERIEEQCATEWERAYLGAAAQWDKWFNRACALVDDAAGEFAPSTVSTVSTSSGLAQAATVATSAG